MQENKKTASIISAPWRKKRVLMEDLNLSRIWEDLIGRGRLFQSLGAAEAKALLPLDSSLVLGTTNSSWSEYRL